MAATALDILGVVSPAAAAIAAPERSQPPLALTLLPGVVGGITGYVVGSRYGHPVLGFLAGDALGLNAYRLYRRQPGDVAKALTNLGVTASLIGGSLMWKAHPFYGALLGLVAGAAVTSFVPGSNAHRFCEKFMGRSA